MFTTVNSEFLLRLRRQLCSTTRSSFFQNLLFFHTLQEVFRSHVVYKIDLLPQSMRVKYILLYSGYLINFVVEPLMCPKMICRYNEAVMKCVSLEWNVPAEYQGCVSGNQCSVVLILQAHECFSLSKCKNTSLCPLCIQLAGSICCGISWVSTMIHRCAFSSVLFSYTMNVAMFSFL